MLTDFSVLKGLILESIDGAHKESGRIVFRTSCGRTFVMSHYQDCCEVVSLEDVIGDINDLIGTPLLMAEKAVDDGEINTGIDTWGSTTWTFYKLATIRGYVTLRWLGQSNGYYSESVEFEEVIKHEA